MCMYWYYNNVSRAKHVSSLAVDFQHLSNADSRGFLAGTLSPSAAYYRLILRSPSRFKLHSPE